MNKWSQFRSNWKKYSKFHSLPSFFSVHIMPPQVCIRFRLLLHCSGDSAAHLLAYCKNNERNWLLCVQMRCIHEHSKESLLHKRECCTINVVHIVRRRILNLLPSVIAVTSGSLLLEAISMAVNVNNFGKKITSEMNINDLVHFID